MRKLFCVLFALGWASVFVSGCGDDVEMPEELLDGAEYSEPVVAPSPQTAWNDSSTELLDPSAPPDQEIVPEVAAAPPEPETVWTAEPSPLADARAGRKSGPPVAATSEGEAIGWSMPNGTHHNALFLDISGSLQSEDRREAADIVTERIQNVHGANKITVYLVGTSYVRFATASSDAERAQLGNAVQNYLESHTFTKAERDYTNYALPLLASLQEGLRELKEHGTRFHASVVGDGWDQSPPGQDAAFIRRSLRDAMASVPDERRHMFGVELINVFPRAHQYADEVHLRDVFGSSDLPVYPASSWSDVSRRFEQLDRDLNGTYSWTNVSEPVRVLVSDFGEKYQAGAYAFSLNAPSRDTGELFTARLVADAGHAASLLGYWKVRGSQRDPVPFSEELVLTDNGEVDIYVGLNRESPPPRNVLWPITLTIPCYVELIPHSAVSLTQQGEGPSLVVARRAWVFRNWFPDKLLGIVVSMVLFVLLVRWLNTYRERDWWSVEDATAYQSEAREPCGEPVGHITYNGREYPVQDQWFTVGNLDVVPTPGRICICPHIRCSMISLTADGPEAPVGMEPGQLVALSSRAVKIRDSHSVEYEVVSTRGGDAVTEQASHAASLEEA